MLKKEEEEEGGVVGWDGAGKEGEEGVEGVEEEGVPRGLAGGLRGGSGVMMGEIAILSAGGSMSIGSEVLSRGEGDSEGETER